MIAVFLFVFYVKNKNLSLLDIIYSYVWITKKDE